MKTIRIFISSPGDVATERAKARQVIADLQKRFVGNLLLEPVFWEDLPLGSDTSFQAGIDYFLSVGCGVDIAVFILWSRLGSPVGPRIRKADGSEYLSGTDREWDLMLKAREASGGVRPDIFTYVREDQDAFIETQRGKDHPQLLEMVLQYGKVKNFIIEHFTDRETGTNTRAYFTFKEPIVFAHHLRTHLRTQLDKMLVDADLSAVVWNPAEQGSPFRGLEVFEYEHAPLFFGREREICDLQIRLRQQNAVGCAFVLLVGASGSGKSSLARAGVAPAVAQYDREDQAAEWRRAVFTPGENKADLLLGLVRALATPHALPELAGENLTELAEDLARDPEMTFRHKLRPLFTGNRRRLLLVFDQIEELFTHGEITAEAQRQLSTALGVLARSGVVWVLGTIRTDYYARFQGVPELLALKGEGAHVDLPPPAVSELHRIIIQPARAAGLRFEENEKDEPLDVRLLADASVHPEALPLLEFCLDALFQRQTTRNDGVLRWTDYEAMRAFAAQDDELPAFQAESGLAGALVSKAEEALASIPVEHQRPCLSAIFSKLLDFSADERETPVRKTALEGELVRNPYHSAKAEGEAELLGGRDFLNAFAKRRLLISGVASAVNGQEPQRTFTVAHEALLRNWPRLRRLQLERAEFFRIRRQVERAEADWLRAKDDSFLLSKGLPLQLATKLAAKAPELLSQNLAEYITRSAGRAEEAEESERLQKEVAMDRLYTARITSAFVQGMFDVIDPEVAKGREITVRELLDSTSNIIEGKLDFAPEIELDIRKTLGNAYLHLGRSEVALRHLRICLRLAKTIYGNSDLSEVADLHDTVGKCLQELGHYPEALLSYEEALAMRRRLFPETHSEVATSLSNVAHCLRALGRNQEALSHVEAALAIRKFIESSESEVANSIGLRAICLLSLGRSEEALPVLEEVLARDRRIIKGDSPSITTSLSNLGFCLQALERYDDALPVFEDALAMARRLFKGDHPSLALSLNNLGACLCSLRRSQEALANLEESLAMNRRLFKGNHPDVASALSNIGAYLNTLNRSEEALPKLEEALSIRQRIFPHDHPDVADSLVKLGHCLDNSGRQHEALSKYEEALAMYQRLFKGDHPDVAAALNYVALCLNSLGRYAEALPKYEEALAMRQRFSKDDGLELADSFLNLGNCLHAMVRVEEAFKHYNAGREMFERLGQGFHVVIQEVTPNGQGKRLGIHQRDVILQYSGESIFTKDQFVNLVGRTKGRDIEMRIRRGEELLTFKVQEGRVGCAASNQTIKQNAKPEQ